MTRFRLRQRVARSVCGSRASRLSVAVVVVVVVVVLDGVRAVGGGAALATADLHESLADEFVVGTAELDVVQGASAARRAAAVAPARRAVLEPELVDAAALAVLQRGRLAGAPRAATLAVAARRRLQHTHTHTCTHVHNHAS